MTSHGEAASVYMPRCCRRVGIGSSRLGTPHFVPFDAVQVQTAMSEIYLVVYLVWAGQPQCTSKPAVLTRPPMARQSSIVRL